MFWLRNNNNILLLLRTLTGIYFCPVVVISGLTDKDQIHYLTGIRAQRGDLPVYNKISFTKINIDILSENT